MPGKSCSMRWRINVVFPVEYCPTSSTMGLLSKSASSRAGSAGCSSLTGVFEPPGVQNGPLTTCLQL
ncbi:hypothetical protein AGIG_G472 [Arapaima gigas]